MPMRIVIRLTLVFAVREIRIQFSIANPQQVLPLPEVAPETHALGDPEC
jgi:hypothetical protein